MTLSQGLFQTIPHSFRDPLANMQAAVNYAEAVYSRPRRAGKATAIAAAAAAAAAGTATYATGGIVMPPDGSADAVPTRLSPGEYVLTPEAARAFGPVHDWNARELELDQKAQMIEQDAARIEPPPPDLEDEFPEPPTPPVFDD